MKREILYKNKALGKNGVNGEGVVGKKGGSCKPKKMFDFSLDMLKY